MGEAEIIDRVSMEDGQQGSVKDGVDISAGGVVVDHGLHRSLKERHMQMIALGGVVGYVSQCTTAKSASKNTWNANPILAARVSGTELVLNWLIQDR